ncbi:SDR family oxidoreductase [Caballeronia grimmiae]|uniref:Short-chain dehydrogenase n=1 Tax=Caballeronia grimmiae TaxID=1071679 RepID=A0A069NMD2_9BURK|nr:SDR family oxidoreductase [Caballeronia grimmiae]KDR26151.1 short-chain dehydrogenase [Caballeronia grimmiae]GGD97827.1 short chain dehydrogenase [Caballeronia grimmiae]
MNTAADRNEAALTTQQTLAGQTVVVVGGKTGIGMGVARVARAAGAKVVVASRRVAPLVERSDLAEFAQVSLDMRDESAVQQVFEEIGALDHLVVTAAPDLGTWGSFMDADMHGVRNYLEGKFLGSWACARHAAPHLRAGGSITFLTGGMAVRPKLGFTAVTSAFAAVEALSGSLALELAPIRINTIRPGFVDTDMWGFLPPEHRDDLRKKVEDTFPARRAGKAEDIGHAALFLMTNSYVTGTVLEVSGGETLVPSVS